MMFWLPRTIDRVSAPGRLRSDGSLGWRRQLRRTLLQPGAFGCDALHRVGTRMPARVKAGSVRPGGAVPNPVQNSSIQRDLRGVTLQAVQQLTDPLHRSVGFESLPCPLPVAPWII